MSLPSSVLRAEAFGYLKRVIRHILASPRYAPGTIAVNVTWMKRGFNACQTHCSMYPSIVNCFPVIQPVSSKKVRHFSTFWPPVSSISLRHNLDTSQESRWYVVAFIRFAGGGIWLPQESLRHILASPRYAPGTITVNVTRME